LAGLAKSRPRAADSVDVVASPGLFVSQESLDMGEQLFAHLVFPPGAGPNGSNHSLDFFA
jgi:hypothetical protein